MTCPTDPPVEHPAAAAAVVDDVPSVATSSKRPRGRPGTHQLNKLRRTLRTLTTNRIDGRSGLAVAVRRWKDDVRRDLGGGPHPGAQETILEDAAQTWVVRSSLDDFIARQKSLVSRKGGPPRLSPVVEQRMRVAEHLARQLDRLGLDRTASPAPDGELYRTPGAGRDRGGNLLAPDDPWVFLRGGDRGRVRPRTQ
jgi:hypothetical protein